MKLIKNKGLRSFSFFTLFLLLNSCDYTPRLHKNTLSAQEFIANQDYKKAVLQYENIIKGTLPGKIKVKVLYQLGELYSIYLNDNHKAVFYYNQIQKFSEELIWIVKAQERLGEIFFTYLKDYNKSRESYKKLSGFVPRLDRVDFYQFRLAQSYMQLNLYKKATKVFSQIKNSPDHKYFSRSLYYLGLAEFKQKHWDDAIKKWREYLEIEKRRDNIVQTVFLIANAYETKENLKKAYNLYYSILGEYPNTDVIKNRLNSIYNRRIARKR
jgi:tetratricopeptide (TPR) repeat protein